MPTYGWIRETVEDRFHERGGENLVPALPRYACPVCLHEFLDADERLWHIGTAHPIERPVLVVGSELCPSIVNIRSSVPVDQIRTTNCTSAFLSRNGSAEKPIEPDQLGFIIASDHDAEFRLRLLNERAEDEAKIVARYRIKLALANREELTEVDRLFVKRVAVDDLSMRDIATFAQEAARYGSARFYTDALVAYATGVLIKEGTDLGGATLPFSEFQGKFMHALGELRLLAARPITSAVIACIALNLNDLASARQTSGIVLLDESLAFFGRLVRRHGVRFPADLEVEPARLPICSVDRDTHDLLTDFAVLSRSSRDRTLTGKVAERAADGTLSTFDRAKVAALAAARHLADEEVAEARRVLVMLGNDPVFGDWADSEIERIGPE